MPRGEDRPGIVYFARENCVVESVASLVNLYIYIYISVCVDKVGVK